MTPLLVLGTSVFATEVADLARAAGFDVRGYVENRDRARCEQPLEGLPVSWIDDLPQRLPEHAVVCGLGTTKRGEFTSRAAELGADFARVIHPTAVVSTTAEVAPGAVISAGVVVASRTRVGPHVLLNRGALVGHHVEIQDHCSIQPGSRIGGSCRIESRVWVGIGATVIDHRTLGTGSVVGAGAVVVDDVEAGTVVMGVPARPVRKSAEGL